MSKTQVPHNSSAEAEPDPSITRKATECDGGKSESWQRQGRKPESHFADTHSLVHEHRTLEAYTLVGDKVLTQDGPSEDHTEEHRCILPSRHHPAVHSACPEGTDGPTKGLTRSKEHPGEQRGHLPKADHTRVSYLLSDTSSRVELSFL